MDDERPTLDDWLGGRVERKTRAETKADHAQRSQGRARFSLSRVQQQQFRQDLYRRLLSWRRS